MHEHLREWIALAELPGVGPGVLLRLMAACDTESAVNPASLLRSASERLRSFNLPSKTLRCISAYQAGSWPDAEYLQAIDVWLDQPFNHLISYACDSYPPLLKQISDYDAFINYVAEQKKKKGRVVISVESDGRRESLLSILKPDRKSVV